MDPECEGKADMQGTVAGTMQGPGSGAPKGLPRAQAHVLLCERVKGKRPSFEEDVGEVMVARMLRTGWTRRFP